MASYTQFGQDRIVISLQGDLRELVVSPGSAAELVLDFPMDNVVVRVEDRDVILECPNGDVIRLVGARGHEGVVYIVEGLDALPSLDAFLTRFASQVAERRGDLQPEEGPAPWDATDPQNPSGRNGLDGDGPRPSTGVADNHTGDGQAARQAGDAESENGGSGQADLPAQADSSGQAQPGAQPGGSGLGAYQTGLETLADRAGSLIPTIDRYDDLGTHWWNDNSAPSPRAESLPVPSPSAQPEATPTIACAHSPGPAYLAHSTVMEGDSHGMRLEISLSKAPSSPLAVTLVIGGDAVMNDGAAAQPDYCHWTSWELVLPGGTAIPATSCMTETAPGLYLLTLPAGITQAHIRVPLENNDISQNDRCFTYQLQNTGAYAPAGGLGGAITIVDECCYQKHNPNWLPPSPEDAAPFAPGHVGPTGPVAHVVIWDGANRSHANGVLEHDTNAVTYRFELYDQHTGTAHTVIQPVDVVLKLTGEHGLVFRDSKGSPGPEDDYILNDIIKAFTDGGAYNVVYDSATGKLSFTLPSGWNAGHIEFTANTVQDTRIELGVDGRPEALRIEVISVYGDEAVRGQGTYTEVYDAPLVGVTASAPEFFESLGHPDLANAMTFTFTLSSASTLPLTLNLDWLTGSSTGLTGDDISYTCSGGTPGINGTNGLPGSIMIQPGVTTVTVTVTAKDDKLSEGRETIRVNIEPAGDGSYIVGDGSNVQGLTGSASTVLIDDTDATYGGVQYYDGPTVKVIMVDASGNPVANQASVAENQGEVYYKVVLVDNNGNYVTATQQITATLKIEGLDGATLGFNGAKPAGWDMSFSENDANLVMHADGTITVTIPVGFGNTGNTDLMFTAETHNDNVNETAKNEGVKISVSNVTGNEALAGNALQHAIEETPVISIEALASHYAEHQDMGFSLKLTDSLDSPTEVRIELTGGATAADFILANAYVGTSGSGGVVVEGAGPNGGTVIKVTVPANATEVKFYLPIKDDAESESNETVVATILPENGTTVGGTDGYTIAGTGNAATSVIVDDTQPWPTGPGVPPEPAGRDLDGPTVKVILVDANGNPVANQDSVAENQGTVYYKVVLVDGNGNYVTATQQITATLKIEGLDGATLGFNGAKPAGWDMSFSKSDASLVMNGDGTMTVTIPVGKGNTGNTALMFKAETNNDTVDETAKNEGVKISVTTVAGNEASAGAALAHTIVETPVVSIEAIKTHYPEHGELGFKLSLTTPFATDTVVRIQLGGDATLNADYLTTGAHTGDTPGGVGYSGSGNVITVTVPAGATSVNFYMPIANDSETEDNESVVATILPQTGATVGSTDKYTVAEGTGKTASTVIVDDTKDWPIPNDPDEPHRDPPNGPVVRLDVKESNASKDPQDPNVNNDRYAVVEETPETEGSITYTVSLRNPGPDHLGELQSAQSPVTVTIQVGHIGGILYGHKAGTNAANDEGDFYFDWTHLQSQAPGFNPATDWNPATGTITVTIPAGKDSVDLKVNIVRDQLTETDRNLYNDKGEKIGSLDDEAFKLTIIKVEGNEAVIHPTANAITTGVVEERGGIQVSIEAVTADGQPPVLIEGGAKGQFKISLSQKADEPVTVVLNATGSAGSEDFKSPLVVTIPAGQTEAWFDLEAFDDYLSEGILGPNGWSGIEGFTLTIVDVVGGEAVRNPAQYSFSGTIKDNGNGPVVSVSGPSAVQESVGDVLYTVTLTGPNQEPCQEMQITIQLKAGTATTVNADPVADPDGHTVDVFFDAATIAAALEAQGLTTYTIDQATGKIVVTIPKGFTGANGDGTYSFTFPVTINDDRFTENDEDFSIAVTKVIGSEGVIGSGATTVITDDSAGLDKHDNGLMDGPFLYLSGAEQLGKNGEMYVSESSGTAKYVITLRDANGNPVAADEDITVTLIYRKYSAASWVTDEDKANRPDADPGKDFETHRVTIKIPAGAEQHEFSITIGDDSLTEDNEWFIVTIDKAVGNEARLPGEEARSAVTVIVDDTQPWPDAASGVWPDNAPVSPPAGHGVLEGPKVSLSGPDSAYESVSGGALAYRLSLDGQIVQDVAVTLQVTPVDAQGDILTLADFFGPMPVGGWTTADVLTALQAKNLGMVITGVSFVDGNDPDKGFLVTVKIPQTDRVADVKIPICNDQFTENKETFQVKIANITGSEASIDTARDTVKTELMDDGNGPRASIHCFDPDLNNNAGGFVTNASIVTKPDSPEYDARGHIIFKLEFSSTVVQAGTKIIVQLTDDNGNPVNPLLAHVTDGKFGDIGGDWTALGGGRYEVTIPVGETMSYLCITKPGGGTTYTATIVGTVNCESDIGSPSYATAHVQSYGGEGPWTHISLWSNPDAYNDFVENGIHYVKEGNAAAFTLRVQGNGISMAHDTNQDGTFDENLTVSVIIRGVAGEGGSAASPNADIVGADIAAFLAAFKADFESNNAYTLSNLSYDTATGRLTFTIDTAGKQYTTGSVANASVDFTFSLPMIDDGLVEGAEYYTVTLGTANKATVNKTPVEMAIVDKDPPTITLTAPGENFVVIEGGEITLRLEMDYEVTSNFSVYLEHNFTGIPEAERATVNSDFIPPPSEINFPSGVHSSGWKYDTGKNVWYYEITVKIPDDATSEPDEKFNIKITGISDKGIVVDDQMPANGVTVTIKDDGNTGPLVSFSESAMTCSEGDTLNVVVLLSKPAMEDVDVYVKVIGLTSPAPGFDPEHPDLLTAAQAAALGLPAGSYLKITVPAGDIEYKWTLAGFLINDKLSKESTEQLKFDIVKVTGGESRVYDGSDTNHGTPGTDRSEIILTVEDVLDGPSVSVAAVKPGDHDVAVTSIEEVKAGTAEAEVDFVFSLSEGVAAQNVTITFEVRGNNGSMDNMLNLGLVKLYSVDPDSPILSATRLANGDYRFTIMIPKDSSEATWSMKQLFDDGYAETNHSFSVVITDVKGNEASIGAGTATVAIVDDDHAPDAGKHKIVMLVPSGDQFTSDITIDIDALAYASDLDAGDILGIIAKTGSLRYGSYVIDPVTHKLTYTIDKNNAAIKKLTEGQVIDEQRFTYEVTDSWASGNPPSGYWNTSTGTVDITIASGTDLTNTKFDRCFTSGEAEWVFGTDRAEVIDARGGADIIRAGGGDDTLIVYADNKGSYYGGDGADSFRLKTVEGATVTISQYAKDTGNPLTDGVIVGGDVKGGPDDNSLDRITLGGDGVTLDASLWDNANMTSVEIIDISRSADASAKYNLVLLGENFVAGWAASGLSPVAGGIPRVTGKSGDMFSFPPGETWAADTAPSALAGYTLYISGSGKKVYIDDNLSHRFTDPADYDQHNAPGKVTIVGGDGADTIIGGAFDDRLIGGGGADTIRSGGGRDTIDAGAGDDHIYIGVTGTATHSIFGSVDGGEGTDTLHLEGRNYTLDLTGLGANTLQNLEIIDISTSEAGAGNTLVINGDTLKNIGGATALYLTGTTDDAYQLTGGGWSYGGISTEGGSWSVWTNTNGQTLYVSTAMAQAMGGTEGNDVLNVYTDKDVVNAGGGNDIINVYNTGFLGIDGGAGIDTVKLMGDGKAFDLDSMAARVTGVEKVDISSGATGNTVTLSGASVKPGEGFTGREGGAPLVIDGTARDSYILSDADGWTYDGLSGSYHIWTHANGGVIHVSVNMTRTVNGDDAANTLAVHTVKDVVDAGGGNDTIYVYEAGFASIKGGDGIDVMKLVGNGQNYSLAAFATKVDGIEIVDISSGSGNTLAITKAAAAGFTNREGGVLTIEGTAADTYTFTDAGWVYGGLASGYHTWTNGTEILKVNAAMKHAVTGTVGGDNLEARTATDVINAGGGNDRITVYNTGFASINGGAGTDILALGVNNAAWDLSALAANRISNIEGFDLTGAGANVLTLSATTFANMGKTALSVTGDATDTLSLLGNWSHNGAGAYTDGTNTVTVSGAAVAIAMASGGTVAVGPGSTVTGSAYADTFLVAGAIGGGSIDGGAGIDTLKLVGDGENYDLAAFASNVTGIEVVDITSAGSGNTLAISAASAAGFTDREGGCLTIEGAADDAYTFTDAGWVYGGLASGYHTWTSGAETLKVNAAMQHLVTGAAGDDQLTVHTATDTVNAGDGNDVIILKSAVFGGIDGGAGFDTLVVDLEGGGTLELTAETLSNLERVEVASGTVTLDLDAITGITGGGNRLEVDFADGHLLVTNTSGWHANDTATTLIGAETYYWYTNDAAELLVKFQLDAIA